MRYFIILLSLFFLSCSNSIRVHNKDNLSLMGIEAWGKEVKYTWIMPDITLIQRKPILYPIAIGYYDEDCKEIQVMLNNDNLIAHEFGHFLGLEHSDNQDSIMFPKVDMDRKLNTYQEFK